mgnify:CR=1 FL=1
MKKKICINLITIVVVVCLVLIVSLNYDFDTIINYIINMKFLWFIIAVIVMMVSRLIIGICSYMMVKINGEHVSIGKMIQINYIIPFFHGITPFSGGGQPMEIYYLHNEGISKTKSTNIVLQNFILFQSALIILSLIAVLYNYFFKLFPSDSFMRGLVTLGFVINFLVLLFSYMLSFSKRANKFILNKGLSFLSKIKIVKNVDTTREKLNNYINKFYTSATFLKKQKRKVLIVLLLNVISLIVQYSVPYVVGIGMGVNNLSFMMMMVATTYVMMIGSFVPIPGGTGGIEYGFVYFVGYIINDVGLVTAIMLIWRLISYYLSMVFGAVSLIFYRKKEKECE